MSVKKILHGGGTDKCESLQNQTQLEGKEHISSAKIPDKQTSKDVNTELLFKINILTCYF